MKSSDAVGLSCFVIALIALEVAAGVPILGAFETQRLPVTYFDWEVGSAAMDLRVHQLAQGLGLRLDDLGADFRYCSHPREDFATDAGTKAILDSVSGGLMVIDALGTASKAADQNDARFALPLVELAAWSEHTGGMSVVLVHTGWNTSRIRGSSAVSDAAGAQWLFVVGRNGRRTLRCEKAHPMAREPGIGIDIDRKPANGGYRLVAAQEQSSPNVLPNDTTMTRVLEAVRGGAKSKRDVYEVIKGDKRVVFASVDACLETGSLQYGPHCHGHPTLRLNTSLSEAAE